MQSMMQNFYRKSKPKKKGGAGKINYVRPKATSKGQTFTMDQLSNSLDKNQASGFMKYSSPAEDHQLQKKNSYGGNLRKKNNKSDQKKLKIHKFGTQRRDDMIEDVLGNPQSNKKDREMLMMKSDIKDFRRNTQEFDDLSRFKRFINDGEEPEDEEEGYGDDKYLVDLQEEKPESNKDMKVEIKKMSKEERDEYFQEKKRKKQQKKDEEFRRIASFKPKINEKSKTIDFQRTRGIRNNRGHMLYDLNKVLAHREKQLKEIVQTEQFMKFGQAEMKNCTFTPKINKKNDTRLTQSSLQERTEMYMKRKKDREAKGKKLRELNETKDCTFRPRINRSRNAHNGD